MIFDVFLTKKIFMEGSLEFSLKNKLSQFDFGSFDEKDTISS